MSSEALWRTLDPALQITRFQQGGGPLSWCTGAALASAFCRDRLALTAIAACVAGTFLWDPGWPFLPLTAIACSLPAVWRAVRNRREPGRCAALAAASLCVALAVREAATDIRRQLASEREAVFVGERMGRGGLLVTLDEPERGFRKALDPQIERQAAFRPRGLLSSRLRGEVDARLAAGAVVWLASDWVFRRRDAFTEDEDDEARRLIAWLEPLRLGSPEVSPQGLYYYPILSRDAPR